MTLTRAEALRLARAATLANLRHYRQAVGAGSIPTYEDGRGPQEQLAELETTTRAVVARLDEMIREEEERVRT